MIVDDGILQEIKDKNVRLLRKDKSKLMRAAGWALSLLGNSRFMKDYWTTFHGTIYYPTGISDPLDPAYHGTLTHEMGHVGQQPKPMPGIFDEVLAIGWLCLYLFFPLPIFFSYFRWKWERECYLDEINRTPIQVRVRVAESIVQGLWEGYLMPWPRSWMRNWFAKHMDVV